MRSSWPEKLAKPPSLSPRNNVWETSAEIPYWWRVTSQIWLVEANFPLGTTNQRHYQDLGISALVSQVSFCGEARGRLWSSQWFLNSVSYEVPSCVNNLHLLACHFYFGKNINRVKPFKIFSRNISKSSWCICQHWRRHGIRILTAFVFLCIFYEKRFFFSSLLG